MLINRHECKAGTKKVKEQNRAILKLTFILSLLILGNILV